MNKKILILGCTGMLGSMVYEYFKSATYTLYGTSRNKEDVKNPGIYYFEVNDFLHDYKKFSYMLNFDYIINCIGILKPHCKDNDPIGVKNAIISNAFFPHALSDYCISSSAKIIQIATDCVFSGKLGNYSEDSPHDALDTYGKTKSLGEVFTGNVLNIRCSIIGPEKETSVSLLKWFLSQKENSQVVGFSDHKWNGITTLQFAKLCLKIIQSNIFIDLINTSHIYHFAPNDSVTKYEMLKLFKKVFNKNVSIIPKDSGEIIDRTLITKYQSLTKLYGTSSLHEALLELKSFMNEVYN